MRRNYFIKSINIIFILLAMLFSCNQPTSENSNNSNNQQNQNQDNNQNGDNTGDDKDDTVTTGIIVGKAMYSNTKSHAGIQVTLVSTDGIVAYDSQISSRSRSAIAVMKNVITSESGEYSFDNVKEGVYTIYASSDDSTEKAVLTNVVVQANQVVTATDLNLTATGSISGKVTLDGKENGNLGILVFVASTSYMSMTDDSGVFTISDVPAGADYQIVIMKGDYCTLWETVSVEAGKENKLADKNITSQKSESDTNSFIWQGSSATPPANPEKYWAYFDTDDGCSYIYDGEKWTLLAQAGKDGENGTNGISLIWKGSSNNFPTNPEKNWAFFNTDNSNSYIYDGEKWSLFIQAGDNGENDFSQVQNSCYSLTHYVGSMSNWEYIPLIDNSFTFTSAGNTKDQFVFTNYNHEYKACGVKINELDVEVQILENTGDNINFASDVLTEGESYTVTLIVRDKHEAYVKVSQITVTDISITSTNHKTLYYAGESLDVTNLTVKVTKSDGTTKNINVTADMVSGFDSSKLGKQTLIITCGSSIATYDIEVRKEIEATANNVVDTISELPTGVYTIKLNGEIDTVTFSNIKMAMNNNITAKITLDLNGVTNLLSIPDGAFDECTNLNGIIIPSSVTTIGDHAFSDCDSLENVIIPDSVISIGGSAFYGCSKLTSIIIPDNVTTIGDLAFHECRGLKNIKLSNNVTSIGSMVFDSCISLESITIPDSVTYIGSAFYACRSLTNLTIPASVIFIDGGAFDGCTNLANVTFENTDNWFYESKNSSDNGIAMDVTNTSNNAAYLRDIYANYSWYWYRSIFTVEANDVVSVISKLSYGVYTINVTGKMNTDILSNIKSVISSNTSLKIALDLSKTIELTDLPNSAFYNCRNLTSIVIPDSVTSIGDSAFLGCSSLTSITIPDSVTEICAYVFSDCSSLTSVTIPDSVTSIEGYAFNSCNNLESINYRGTQEQWEQISIVGPNNYLTDATINYNYTGE